MKRIILPTLAASVLALLAGCGSSAPKEASNNAAQSRQVMKAGSAAPTARAAPPGVAVGDHRGGLAGGTISGMTKK